MCIWNLRQQKWQVSLPTNFSAEVLFPSGDENIVGWEYWCFSQKEESIYLDYQHTIFFKISRTPIMLFYVRDWTAHIQFWIQNGFSISGDIRLYSGGGYVFELRGNEDKLLSRSEQLERTAWVDQYTRAIFIEFTVYNPGTNLFSINTMLLEKPDSGSFHPRWR